jgi:hypothetical protein
MRERTPRREIVGAGLIGALLVVLLAGIVPAGAAAGDNLILGSFNTAGTSKTTVWANTNNWAVRIKQARADQAALKLETNGGPPLIVNSSARVTNFNADLLDGLTAAHLIRAGYDADENADDTNGVKASVRIGVPQPGLLLISGHISATGTGDTYVCHLDVDDVTVPGGSLGTTTPGDCALTGATAVDVGWYDVELKITGRDTAGFGATAMWVVYVPFDQTGNPPDLP